MQTPRRRLLGEILVDAGLISPEQARAAHVHQRQTGPRMGEALVALGYVSEDDVAWALSRQLNLPYVHLTPEMVTGSAAARLPMAVMEHHRLIPIAESVDGIVVVMADPTDQEVVAEVARLTGLPVLSAIGLASNIQAMLDHLRDGAVGVSAADSGVTTLLFHLSAAMHLGATEVYFDPASDGVRIRYRTPWNLTASQKPSITADALEMAVRAVGSPAGDGRKFLLSPQVGALPPRSS